MAATIDTTPRTPLERELDSALHETLDEIDALKAENGRLKGRLDALMTAFDANGALGVLQKIMHDEDLKPELRVKAAGLAVGFERPKPASTVNNVVKLYDILEAARLKEQAAKTIEHQPKKPLDLEGPTPSTIVGGPPEEGWDPNDPGHDAEGEADPAA
jgi:hypothetical protein